MFELITATMATYAARYHTARQVIEQIAPQVDRMRVFVNDEGRPPFWPALPDNVEIWLASRMGGSIGDCGKFFQIERLSGLIVCVDDDIQYPGDYVARLDMEARRRGYGCAVGYHGCNIPDRAVTSYYREGQERKAHFTRGLGAARHVHVIGTGTLAFHTGALDYNESWRDLFPVQNMADLWFALHCEQRNVPRLILPRKAGYLKSLPTRGASIYERYHRRDAFQTALINNNNFAHV